MMESSRRQEGFTLLEIMVVLFLVTLIAFLVMPRLSLRKTGGIRRTSRDIVREFRVLHWEAISRQEMVRLEYDLDHRHLRALIIDPSGTLKPLSVPGVKDWTLPGTVRFVRVDVLHDGKVTDGKTFTQFFPEGSVEPTRIHLTDKQGKSLTLVVSPFTGRVRVMEREVNEKRTPPPFYGAPGGEIPQLEDYSLE